MELNAVGRHQLNLPVSDATQGGSLFGGSRHGPTSQSRFPKINNRPHANIKLPLGKTRIKQRLLDDLVKFARDANPLKMRAAVHPTQFAFRLIVAHHAVEADNFVKTGSGGGVRLVQIIVVDNDFKDGSHGIALLVDKRTTLRRTQDRCDRQHGRYQASQGWVNRAHRHRLPYWSSRLPTP